MGRYDAIALEKDKWNELLSEAELYELTLPKTFRNLRGKEESWKGIVDSGYHDVTKARILEITAVWVNAKNTVKVIVCGKENRVAMFSRESKVSGFTGLKFDRYSDESCDIFDNIRKGTWIVAQEGYWSSENQEIAFITNESTMADVKKILDTLLHMYQLRQEYNKFNWKSESAVRSYGTVTLAEVLAQELIFQKTLRRHKWVKRKARWDLWNAVKANLSLKTTTDFIVKIQALDGKTYELKAPPEASTKEQISWQDSSIYKLDYWLPFVYRKPKDIFFSCSQAVQTLELVNRLLRILEKLPEADLELKVDKRTVKITRKKSSAGAILQYLNGNLVKGEEIEPKVADYFNKGSPIFPSLSPTLPNQPSQKPTKRPLSEEAKRLIEEGLNGVMRDLEGEFPFHLNIIYDEKKRKWYLEMAGKKFHIKGGYNSLKKVRSAILGSAMLKHGKEGYDSRATKIVKSRIAELVGDKDALWIVLHVKRMGAMMKAITGQGDN